MADTIACRHIVCARAMDADKGKEIIRRMKKNKTKTYWVQMADTIVCGCVACVWAADMDEADKKRRKLTRCGLWT